jgi:hypothetical protein
MREREECKKVTKRASSIAADLQRPGYRCPTLSADIITDIKPSFYTFNVMNHITVWKNYQI